MVPGRILDYLTRGRHAETGAGLVLSPRDALR